MEIDCLVLIFIMPVCDKGILRVFSSDCEKDIIHLGIIWTACVV